VNRSQLLNAIADRNELSRRDADELLTSVVDIITETVCTGEDVTISGFAKFRRVDRKARMGRNPATGETIKIAAKRQAKITPLKAFKDSVLSGRAPRKPAAKKTTAKKATAKKTTAKKAVKKAPVRKAVKKTTKKTAKKTARR
jgi:DNA-binding protein HU-beta